MINKGKHTKTFDLDDGAEPTEALGDLERSLLGLVGKIRSFSLATLGISMECSQAVCKAGTVLDVGFVYTNSGTSRISFMNPKVEVENADSLLSVQFWKQVIAEDGTADEDLALSIDCTQYEFLTGPHECLSSDRLVLGLDPGENLEFSVRFPLPKCEPGLYVAEGIYRSHETGPDKVKNHVAGEYHTDGVQLRIEPVS
jgi:hypothetical protein